MSILKTKFENLTRGFIKVSPVIGCGNVLKTFRKPIKEMKKQRLVYQVLQGIGSFQGIVV
jgi:hypothetical protein